MCAREEERDATGQWVQGHRGAGCQSVLGEVHLAGIGCVEGRGRQRMRLLVGANHRTMCTQVLRLSFSLRVSKRPQGRAPGEEVGWNDLEYLLNRSSSLLTGIVEAGLHPSTQ